MPQRLLNKVAVVTGASDALGRAVVERFVGEGAKVVVFGRDRGRLEELTALAEARVIAQAGDVTKPDDLRDLAAFTVRRFGGIDVLVPAAEVLGDVAAEPCTPAFLSTTFAVNLLGAQQTVRAFDRHLNRGATIVIVTAPAAVVSAAGLDAFAATKAALSSLTKSLAVELSHRGIRVNGVAPVQIDPAPAKTDAPTQSRERALRQAEQAADAVLFLASADAAGVTGQELIVDAGVPGRSG